MRCIYSLYHFISRLLPNMLKILLEGLALITSCSCSFPPDLTIYEFGSKEHSFGGLKWDDIFNHPRPYGEPVSDTMASLFQYLTPDPMPSTPFPTNAYTICWNMKVRVFNQEQTRLIRFFHNENTEWSEPTGPAGTGTGSGNGDFWHQINFCPARGTLIMKASMMDDKTKRNIWSGGLGVGNFSTTDNALLRWTSICMANDLQNCWTRFFIGKRFDDPMTHSAKLVERFFYIDIFNQRHQHKQMYICELFGKCGVIYI